MDATVPGVSRTVCSQGALSIDLSPIVYAAADTLGAGDTATLMVGTNDVWVCGMGCASNFTKALTGMAAILALPSADRISARSMNATGAWVPDDDIPGAMGRSTTSPGAALTFQVTTPEQGHHLYLAWKATDGSSAHADVTIDGQSAGSLLTAGDSTILTPHQTRNAVFAVALPLGSAGPHTVTITSGTPDAFTLEWAGVNTHADVALGTPHLILGTVPREYQQFDDRTAAFSQIVTDVASLLRSDGMFVELADTHAALGSSDFADDWVHPNNDGHAHLAAAFLKPQTPPAASVAP